MDFNVDFKKIFDDGEGKKTAIAIAAIVLVVVVLAVFTYLTQFSDESSSDPLTELPQALEITPQAPQMPQITQDSPLGQMENPTAPSIDSVASQEDSVASQITPPTPEPQIAVQTAPQPLNPPKNIAQDSRQDSPSSPAPSTISRLQYSIKPLNRNIATCYSLPNGKWALPNKCRDNIVRAVRELIASNSEIIALEISGVVDSNPYSGPSAELKQEGLASFRAREAIRLLTISFSEVAVFEGLSIQEMGKRGVEVKAYYLKK